MIYTTYNNTQGESLTFRDCSCEIRGHRPSVLLPFFNMMFLGIQCSFSLHLDLQVFYEVYLRSSGAHSYNIKIKCRTSRYVAIKWVKKHICMKATMIWYLKLTKSNGCTVRMSHKTNLNKKHETWTINFNWLYYVSREHKVGQKLDSL